MLASSTDRANASSSRAAATRGARARWHFLWLWRSPGRFLLMVVALLGFAFPKLVLGWNTMFYGDFGVLAYPFVFLHRSLFWSGEVPLWNPFSNCGAPFMAQWGTLTLYPFSLIYLLLPMPWSLHLFSFGHLAWGAVGMYVLGRSWTCNRLAGAAAGVFFVFNGLTLSCLLWPNYAVALGWLPWVILLAERAVQQGGRPLFWATLAAACQLLSGVPELVLLTWLTIAALALRERFQGGLRWGSLLMRLGLVVVLAGGLAAAQILPFLELLAHSQRDAQFATSKWALPGWGWGNLLVPLFHAFQTPQGTYFQFGQTFLSSVYLGLPVLLLAMWALWKVRTPRVWILGGLLMFSLVMSLGEAGWVYGWVRRFVPVVGVGRYPVKFMILAVFTVPMLAAFGLAALQRSRRDAFPTSFKVVLAGMVLAVGGVLWIAKHHPFPYDQWSVTFGNAMIRLFVLGGSVALMWMALRHGTPFRKGLCWAMLFGLVVCDARLHSPRQVPTLSAGVMSPGLWQEFRTNAPPRIGEGRVLITPPAEARLLRSYIEDMQQDFMSKRLALWSNLNLLDGIPKVNGSSTLQIREQKEVQDIIYKPASTNALPQGLMDFLGASWITSSNSFIQWDPRPSALPWITGGQQPRFLDREQTLARLASAEFNPAREVLLPDGARDMLKEVQSTDCTVQEAVVTPNRIRFQVTASAPAMVVVAQSHYPNWKATVDGQRVPLLAANHAFQALAVPAGRHEVELRYVDAMFHSGLGITLAAAVASLLLWRRTKPGL